MKKSIYIALIPVLLSFFVMGFVDLVGTATSYVKEDFGLDNKTASLFASMVFFWFLLLSVPTGMLMNRIGRRKTVLISLVVTAAALLLPFVYYTYPSMLISFCLLGIGNTLMQVSLNPLLSNIVTGDRLASTMTFGQFVKAIASMSAAPLAGWAANTLGDWRYMFPIFMGVAVVATLWLGMTSIKEDDEKGESASFWQCFALLGEKVILLSFLGIMCHVGLDVGMNISAPEILKERLGLDVVAATYATTIYFFFRTIGCFSGAFILARFSAKKFFLVSSIMIILGVGGLFVAQTLIPIYICIALVGFGNSNVFPIIFSQALLSKPEKKNEVSGLMIMGLVGGAIFPYIMGVCSDALSSQTGALLILILAVAYLFFFSFRLKEKAA